MSTPTFTLDPQSLPSAVECLKSAFATSAIQGAIAIAKRESIHVTIPLALLSEYRFRWDPEQISWKGPRKKVVVKLHGFSMEQQTRDNVYSLVLRQLSALVAHDIPKSSAIREVFLRRSARAVHQLASLEERTLVRAVEAPTDVNVLVSALSADAALESEIARDPLASARIRGIAAKQQMLEAEGGAASGAQAAELLGISRQAIDKRRRDGKLLALELGKKGYFYPLWQFELKGVDALIRALSPRNPWEQLSFFVNPHAAVGGRSPIQVLRTNPESLQDVLRLATSYGDQEG